MAEALYRKYRPQIFEDVVGQEHIERTLKNAIEQDKVSHAYLFCGPRGTGKTTTARLLAKALLCGSGPTSEPDGTCDDCKLIAQGEHPDVYELDAASRTGVENVREEIIGRVQFAPTRGRYKIYIIDEVHMLSVPAFNALLKTLEEPPSHVVFILATTDPQRVPETIHSRCQRFDFRRISAEAIVSRLGAICVFEGVEFEGEALDLIAHRAEGGMRNALTSLEQLIAFGGGKVTLTVAERLLGCVDSDDMSEIMQAVGKRDVATCFRWTAQYVETGADLAQFVRDMAAHVRDLYVLSLAQSPQADWLEIGAAERRQIENELPLFGSDRLSRLLGVLGDLSAELKTATNPRLSFEIALTRMVRPDSDITLEGLAERIEELEKGRSSFVTDQMKESKEAEKEAESVTSSQLVEAAMVSSNSFISNEGFGEELPKQLSSSEKSIGLQQAYEAKQELPSQTIGVPHKEVLVQMGESYSSVNSSPNSAEQIAGEPLASQAESSDAIVEKTLSTLRDPSGMQRVWRSVLAYLKRQKAAYGVLFLNTRAVYDEGSQRIRIIFPDENEFAFNAIQKPEVHDAVGAGFVNACGQEIPFFYQRGESSVGTSASGKSKPLSNHANAMDNTARSSLATHRNSSQGGSSADFSATSGATSAAAATVSTTAAIARNDFESKAEGTALSSPQQSTVNATSSSDNHFRGSLKPDGERTMPGIPQSPAASVPSAHFEEEFSVSGDMPPWEDEMVPYDNEYVSFEEESASACDVVPKDTSTMNVSFDENERALLGEKSVSNQQLQEELNDKEGLSSGAADIQAILSAGFGEGVLFEEVEE